MKKKNIYDPKKYFFKIFKYKIKKNFAFGLLSGSRGTILQFFSDVWKNLYYKKVLFEISNVFIVSSTVQYNNLKKSFM